MKDVNLSFTHTNFVLNSVLFLWMKSQVERKSLFNKLRAENVCLINLNIWRKFKSSGWNLLKQELEIILKVYSNTSLRLTCLFRTKFYSNFCHISLFAEAFVIGFELPHIFEYEKNASKNGKILTKTKVLKRSNTCSQYHTALVQRFNSDCCGIVNFHLFDFYTNNNMFTINGNNS